MKTSEAIYSKIRERIHSEDFKLKYRLSQKAFIRNCILNFSFLVIFILNQLKKSNAAEIDSSTSLLGRTKNFTKSALSKARLKLSPNAFIELNDVLIEEFYKKKTSNIQFCNFTVLAIDGSKFQLPESDQLKLIYGSASNQNGDSMNMSQGSQLIDVMNGIVLHTLLLPCNTSERNIAIEHVNFIIEKRKVINSLCNSIILFDRGYPGILLIAKLFHNNIQFIMRSSKGFLKIVNDFVSTGKKDGIIKIDLQKVPKFDREKILTECPGIDLNREISVRIVVVELSTGEKEVLLTSLLDDRMYKYRKFKKFYSLRWGIETVYGFEKIRWEIENFSGKSEIAVKQDYYASIFNFNMTVVLAIEAKNELDKSKKIKHRKYDYEINYSIALAYMKNRFICALLNVDIKPKEFCTDVKARMKTNIEPIRLGRKFEHKRKYYRKRFPTNTRAVI